MLDEFLNRGMARAVKQGQPKFQAARVCIGVFVVIGIFVGIFLVTIIFQRIVQSHFHLLAMRAEAKRFIVKDLAQSAGASRGPDGQDIEGGAAAGLALSG